MHTTIAPPFNVTVHRDGREDHVLWLGGEAPPTERSEAHAGRRTIWTDEEKALLFGRPEDTPAARRDAAIQGLTRQAEALGISVVNLINEALLAEIDVRDFERRTGRALEMERFVGVARLMRVMDDARDCERKTGKPLTSVEELHREIAEGWKSLDVLKEIFQNVPRALECWRVRYALEWLRAPRLLREEKGTPRELKALLRRIGAAIADPTKIPRLKPDPRRERIYDAWGGRAFLGSEAREDAARALGFRSSEEGSGAWASLARVARRYIARARAMGGPRRRRRGNEPKSAGSGRPVPPEEEKP